MTHYDAMHTGFSETRKEHVIIPSETNASICAASYKAIYDNIFQSRIYKSDPTYAKTAVQPL
jgi:hypothetical protein